MTWIQEFILKVILRRYSEMFEKIRLMLAGKKTYLVAIVAILGTILAWANGAIDTAAAVKAIIEAILACTVRAGVAKVA